MRIGYDVVTPQWGYNDGGVGEVGLQVVVDANSVCADFRFRSTVTKTIVANAKHGTIAVYLPAVCIDEAVAVFKRQLIEAQAPAEKAAKIYRRLGLPAGVQLFDTEAIEEETIGFRRDLDSRLLANNIQVIEYDSLPSHAAIVRRAIDRRRPFLVDDEGYRDALVWEGVKWVAQRTHGPVVFVSGDGGFKPDNGHGSLHDDLLGDLRDSGIDTSRITRYDRLSNVIDSFEWLKDIGEESDEWQHIQSIEEGQYAHFDIEEIALRRIIPSLIGLQLDVSNWNTPIGCDAASIKAVDIGAVDILGVRDVADDEILVEASADAQLSVDLLVPRYQALSLGDPGDLTLRHHDNGKSYIPIEEAVLTVFINFEVRYNHAHQRVVDIEVEPIDISYGSF